MEIEEIITYTQQTHSGLVRNTNWGEVGLFYNPDQRLKKGIYLLTFKEKNGAHDTASDLDRPDVYRLNLGIPKKTFIELFGVIPARPKAGSVVAMKYDFSALDTIMPHPIYGWMAWICVLNPSPATFEAIKPLIAAGYALALTNYQKKITGLGHHKNILTK